MLVIPMVNQKGGVGKTAMALNLAAMIHSRGNRVLVVDLDPQANATATLDAEAGQFDTNDVLAADLPGVLVDAIVPSSWGEGLDVAPSSLKLANREGDTDPGTEFRLRKAMQGLNGYDVVVIDCPPSCGRLTVNALIAATHALVVTEPSALATQGVGSVIDTIRIVRDCYRPDLVLAGIIVNRVPATREAALRQAELIDGFGDLVWRPAVPLRAAVPEALGAHVAVTEMGSRARDVVDALELITDQLLALKAGVSA